MTFKLLFNKFFFAPVNRVNDRLINKFWIINLFSSFDSSATILFYTLILNWLLIFIGIILVSQIFWLINSQFFRTFLKIIFFLEEKLKTVFGEIIIQGTIFILINNFIRLFPYVFTSSRHSYWTFVINFTRISRSQFKFF